MSLISWVFYGIKGVNNIILRRHLKRGSILLSQLAWCWMAFFCRMVVHWAMCFLLDYRDIKKFLGYYPSRCVKYCIITSLNTFLKSFPKNFINNIRGSGHHIKFCIPPFFFYQYDIIFPSLSQSISFWPSQNAHNIPQCYCKGISRDKASL